jgi:hypothetical protein
MVGPNESKWSAMRPAAARPTTLPAMAVMLMTPLALPRSEVGNSSALKTVIAGTWAAKMMPPRVAAAHIAGPPMENCRASSTTPTAVATEPTSRRPLDSARRPPATIPIPAGVEVSTAKVDRPAAEKPRSSRRNSGRNCVAGPMNTLSRKYVADRRTSRGMWSPNGIDRWGLT